MIVAPETYNTRLNAPVRSLMARVELHEGSTLLNAFTEKDRIKSFNIERVGESSKFFGFGICQKLNLHLIDKDRELECPTSNSLKVHMGADGNTVIAIAPEFHITEVHRDELTNEMSITAYDKIYKATSIYTIDIDIPTNYSILDMALLCGEAIGCNGVIYPEEVAAFTSYYEGGANIEGSESIRDMLDAIAEATQTIYYLDPLNRLIFKRLDKDGEAVFEINKERYFEMDSGNNRRLAAICSATELGDNVEAKLEVSGTTQFVRDNPFWDLQEGVDEIVEAALAEVGGFTINQFDCQWRGNFLVEIGDKLALQTKEDNIVYSYLLNDVLSYDGTLSQHTKWDYVDNDYETATNPSNLGDALKQTYAKVDKVGKQIELVASETESNTNAIAGLKITTDSVITTVQRVEEKVDNLGETFEDELDEIITNKVETAISSEQLKITVEKILQEGVDKVYTTTGYSFDADGLKISKTGSEMESILDEDGLKIFRDNTEVLTVNNTGVNGINMTVRQYLIVGGSRFEAYGSDRTGCFWVGQGG